MKPESTKSYDWLEDALLTLCRKVFPLEISLRVHSIEQKPNRLSPHRDYLFYLVSSDTEFRMQLRLHFALFSLWSGTEDLKTAKEYSVMRHAYQHGYPAPFPYCFSPSLRPFGYPYLVMDAGDGRGWWEMEASLSAVHERTVDAMADLLAQLHLTVPARHPLIPPVETCGVVKRLWSRVLSLGDEELTQCFQGCYRQLEQQIALPSVLLHGCFEMENILLLNGNLRMVTNWEHAALGDPRWDVAYTSLSLHRGNDRSPANRFIARYVQKTDTPMEDLGFWEGLVALRGYALSRWLRALDEKSYKTVAGMQTNLFPLEDVYHAVALKQFT